MPIDPEQPPAEPAPLPSPVPDLPAPPGVTVNSSSPLDNPSGASLNPLTSPKTSQVNPLETASGQLRDLFGDSGPLSPLVQQARGDALKASASKGLQNSSLAVQAGEQAVLREIMPVAQSNAATYERRALANQDAENQFGLQRLQGEQASKLQGEGHAQKLIEQAQAGDINSKLQLEKFGFDTQLSAQENVARLEQLAAQGNIEAKARLEQFNFQSLLMDKDAGNQLALEDKRLQGQMSVLAKEYTNALGLNEQDAKLWIDKQNLQHSQTLEQIRVQAEAAARSDTSVNAQQHAAQLQSQYLASVAQRQAMGSQEISAIYQQQGLTPAQQQNAVSTAIARVQTDLATLAAYYQTSPNWDTTWGQAPSVPPPGAAPGAGGPGMTIPTPPSGPSAQDYQTLPPPGVPSGYDNWGLPP